MRLRLTLQAEHGVLPWQHLQAPGRAVLYTALESTAPELAARLHDHGVDAAGRTPLAYSTPVFPRARRQRGQYRVGGEGRWEIASPLPEVVQALAGSFTLAPEINWAGTTFTVTAIAPVPPRTARRQATLRATTPVVLKRPYAEQDQNLWIVPGESAWVPALSTNLQRKAAALGLDEAVSVDDVSAIGPQRRIVIKDHDQGQRHAIGATATVALAGTSETLDALADWGLGQNNASGFGWCA